MKRHGSDVPGHGPTALAAATFMLALRAEDVARFAAGFLNAPLSSAAFLAAPSTQFITGQTLFVDGGKSLGGLGI